MVAPLSTSNYFYDDGDFMNTSSSASLTLRGKRFRSDESNKIYHNNSVQFIGPLYTDMKGVKGGIPPGIEVKLELRRASKELQIDSLDGTTGAAVASDPNYVLKLDKLQLHIKVGRLSTTVFSRYEQRLNAEAATIRFRRLIVRNIDVPQGSNFFQTPILFGGDEVPNRLWVAFTERKILDGDYTKAYFQFSYRWKKSQVVRNNVIQHEQSLLDDRHSNHETRSVMSYLREAFGLAADRHANQGHQEVTPPGFVREPPQQQRIVYTGDDYVFVKSVVLDLNGKATSSLDLEEGDKYGSISSFYSFCRVNGMCTTGHSNGMTFDDFRKAYNFYSFDNSGCNDSYDDSMEPSVRMGYYRLTATFSEGLPTNLNCLIISEFPSSITVGKMGKIERSYAV